MAKGLAATAKAIKRSGEVISTSKLEVFFGLFFLIVSMMTIRQTPLSWGINIIGTDVDVGQVLFALLMTILGGGVGSVLKFPKTIDQLKENTTQVNEAIKNIIQLSRDSHEDIQKLESIYFCSRIQKYHKGWEAWKYFLFKEELVSPHYGPEVKAWIKMMEIYLDDEAKFIEGKRRIRTTSDVYVNLMDQIGRLLYERYTGLGNKCETSVYRFQVTGMLPEEFYNGYQLERTVNPNRPIIFFNHSWENPDRKNDATYRPLHQKFNRREIKVRRCVVVRKQGLRDCLISSLSSRDDLEQQKHLCVHVRADDKTSAISRDVDQIKNMPLVIERLLWKNNNNIGDFKDIINELIGAQQWNCYPIIDERCISKKDVISKDWKFENLMGVFCDYYHSDANKDALYYEFADHVEVVSPGLEKYLESGSQPEIALFGQNVGFGDEPPLNWDVGIVGRYRPFTREIQISFYCGVELKKLVEALGFLVYPESSKEVPRPLLSLCEGSFSAAMTASRCSRNS